MQVGATQPAAKTQRQQQQLPMLMIGSADSTPDDDPASSAS